jgi:uncharacterized protein (DUF934 family)
MQRVIKNQEIANDSWTLVKEVSDVDVLKRAAEECFIVPLEFWNQHRNELENYFNEIAIWLDSNESVNDINHDLNKFSLIALNFPVFSDGRSYTNARELRQRLNYTGEIRAIGDVLRDQIFYMSRCGFNSFSIRYDQNLQACLQAFNDFQTSYQSTSEDPKPLFRRR